MVGRRQFSLKYLMAEITLLALALGLTKLVRPLIFGDEFYSIEPLLGTTLVLAAIVCWGGFFGGLFGRMIYGALFAVGGVLLAMLLLPAVKF